MSVGTLIILRPASLEDLATVLGLPASQLKALVRRHRIPPAIRIGRRGFYGPREVRRICGLAQDGSRPAPAARG